MIYISETFMFVNMTYILVVFGLHDPDLRDCVLIGFLLHHTWPIVTILAHQLVCVGFGNVFIGD